MASVGQRAPAWCVNAYVNGEQQRISSDQYAGRWHVLYWYPLDFTFVCPSEIIAFDNHLAEFKERAVDVLGVSVDSHFTHHAWRETDRNKGGIGRIGYTLVADLTKQIARDYDVLTGDGAVAYRGLFLIDKQGKVRHQVVNDLPLGRSVEETLRMVDALQFHESHGEVCLANWSKGKAGMKANAEGVAAYLAENASKL